MMKTILIMLLALTMVLVLRMVRAHSDDLTEAQELIASSVPCEELAENQVERIDDYYMEQRHPGKEHEIMDAMTMERSLLFSL